eukprot:CAMPEP_0178901610 /NCGR_PEP_ID=MMETSP0786-20121207/4129_1 /TAXON_ID=186022 /ORGANISM="Thalassionema frauenfeldii, Strain CCMP 1798" /LENGTH=249 /DNA_ID=CAMNT_0020572753 /DNA_START=212 /DNA_END=958 /DNA_ORIENTATION=+
MSSVDTEQSLRQVKGMIAEAISLGAPAYNSGDISKCAQVYQSTAKKIAPLLSENLQTNVQNAIDKSYANADEEAWAFRRELFDAIMDYSVPFMPSSNSKVTLEKFTKNMIPTTPVIVNDNVMGGVSTSRWNSAGTTFSGKTSLANNGGFASLRWRMRNIQNWSYAKGLYLKVEHSMPSKHTFNIILKDANCERVRLSNFKNAFCNPSNNQEDAIFIPFVAFDQMEQMGRSIPGSPTFNRGAVTELGVMA